MFGTLKSHLGEFLGCEKSTSGKILGHLIPMLEKYKDKKFPWQGEKKGIFLSRVRVWYPFPNLGNSQKKHNENPETTLFIHKLGITNITCDIAMNSSIWTINSWSLSKFRFSHFCCKFLILFDSCEHSLLSISDASML